MRSRHLLAAAGVSLALLGATSLPTAASTNAPGSKAHRALLALDALHLHTSPPHPQATRASTAEQSVNWSGYADVQPSTGATAYIGVSGSWVQPTLKCTSEDRVVVFWVGLDGWTSSTVEQDGTLAQCFQGTAFYYEWWEMYPTNNIQVVGGGLNPGDQITASVQFSGGVFTLAVTNSTTPSSSFSTNQACAAGLTCARSSAEWIAERPSNSYGLYPLAQYSLWSVTGAAVKSSTKSGNIGTFPNDKVTMMDISFTYPLAVPSGLNSTHDGFTDKWKNSY